MFERERKLYAFNLAFCERLLADVSEEEFSEQPAPGMNPPRWIVGHLAVSSDGGARLLGGATRLPGDWHAAFSAGSKPVDEAGPKPTKEELLRAIRETHERLLSTLDAADPASLDQPHGVKFESVERFFPTRGDLLAFLMSGHEAFHLGQLSAWRRARGRAPLF